MEVKMTLDIYNVLIGIISAAVFQFVIFAVHIRDYKKEKFLLIWLLGTGFVIAGFFSSFLARNEDIQAYVIMVHNLLLILGQGLYYISLKKYFKPKDMIKNYRLDLGLVIFFLTIFSVFSQNITIRMISNSLVLLLFSLFSLRLLNQNRSEDIRRGSNLFIISNWINIVFWTYRILAVYFVLPKFPRLYEMIIVMSYLSSLMLCVLGSLGLIFLINQRLTSMLEKEKLKFMTIIETSPDSVVVTNLSDGKIVIANNNFMKKMQYSMEELLDETTVSIKIWKDQCSRENFLNAIKNSENIEKYEDYLYAKDGSKFLGCISANKMSIDGEEYIISIIRDVTKVRETEKKLLESERKYKELAEQLKLEKEIAEKNSLTDGLTGLANRRYLEDRIFYEFARMKRTWMELSIIMIDVDYFKLYNDTYGHMQGDECLKIVANELNNSVKRATDLVARYGGEEFVVLLPNTGKEEAHIMATSMKKNIENLKITHELSDVSSYVTVSVGVATFNRDTKLPCNMLIQQADEALYLAKDYGRNQVVAANL